MQNPASRRLRIAFASAVVILSLVFIGTILTGCSGRKNNSSAPARNNVIIAIEGDIDSFNPLFAEDANAGEVNDLLYPGLTMSRFDTGNGVLENSPLIAERWESSADGNDLTFHLKRGATWADGAPLTARDVQFSYELYSDTAVGSVRQSACDALRRTPQGNLDMKQAVEARDDSTVIFHFQRPYPGQMFDAGLPILPEHVFSKVDRRMLRGDSLNHHPLSSGPFQLKEWKAMDQTTLIPNSASTLPAPARIPELIVRVIPEYQTRLAQFKSGEIDVMPLIEVEDAQKLLREDRDAEIVPIGERFYDAIHWNNIDPSAYVASHGKKLSPHPLFGSAGVRRALTMAIDRRELVATFLAPYGREAFGPVSPLFRWAYNDTLKPPDFNPEEAAKLLAAEGWKDTDGDGIIDKGGKPFRFSLRLPAGNQLRANVAQIVQRRLRAIHIDMQIEQIERSAFWDDIMAKKFDACIAGFTVPLQMQLDEMWGGDFSKAPFNLASYRNARVDAILAGAKSVAKETDHAAAWKEFQSIIVRDQPCTFLYWVNDLVAVNKRVRGTRIGLLGTMYNAGEWYLESSSSSR